MVKVELLRVLSVVGGKKLHISPSRGVCNNPTFAYLGVSACVWLCLGHEGVSAKDSADEGGSARKRFSGSRLCSAVFVVG